MRQNQILSKVRRKKKKYISGAEPVVALLIDWNANSMHPHQMKSGLRM